MSPGSCTGPRGDVHVVQPHLAVARLRVGVADGDPGIAHGLDLRTGQYYPCLDAVEKVVIETRPPVVCDGPDVRPTGLLLLRLFLPFAFGRHRSAACHSPKFGNRGVQLLVGEGDGVAKLVGHATRSTDFVDHYRGQDERFDYVWEERWVRDEGFLKIVPEAVAGALDAAGLDAAAIDHF